MIYALIIGYVLVGVIVTTSFLYFDRTNLPIGGVYGAFWPATIALLITFVGLGLIFVYIPNLIVLKLKGKK